MPPKSLREQMLQSLAEDEKRKTTVGVPNLLPTYEPTQAVDDEYGSILDALSAFGTHALSSATLGGTELLGLETEDWEDKNTAERIGASFGEVAGMLAPFGSFNLMARGLGKAAGALSRQGTKQVISRSAARASELAAEKLGKKTIIESLEKAAFTDVGSASLKRYSLGAKYADDITDLIGQRATSNVTQAFREAGVKATSKEINAIVNGFKQGIKEGKHINTVERWIESAAGIGAMAPGFKKGISRYLSMAAAETITLSMYNVMAGAAHSHVKDKDFGTTELMETLKHSAFLGFAFPAARRIGGGGNITMKDGWNRLWSGFKAADYSVMAAKEGGEEVVKSFAKSLIGGRQKNLLAGIEWKVGDKAINLSKKGAIDSLTGKETVELLNQIRSYTLSDGMKIWSKEWISDMGWSSGRMAVGALINNTNMFVDENGEYTDSWKRYPKSEFMAHMIIGAFFTRGRGAWNHPGQGNASLKDHYRIANLLGLDVKGVEARIKAVESNDIASTIGAGLHTDPTTSKIYDLVESRRIEIQDRIDKGKTSREFDAFSENSLNEAMELHYMMDIAKQKDPFDHRPLDLRYLSKDSRRELIEELNGIELYKNNKGESIYLKDIDSTTRNDLINIRLGEGSLESYRQFLNRLNEIDIPISISETGEIIVPDLIPDTTKGKPDIAFMEVKGLIDTLVELKLAKKDASLTFDYDSVMGGLKGAENRAKLKDIIRESKESMISEIFGEGVDQPGFDFFNNQVALGQIQSMQATKAFMSLYDMTMGNTSNLSPQQKNIVTMLERAFGVEGGKVMGDPFRQIKPYIEGKEGERLEIDINNNKDMESLAEFYQIAELFTSGKSNKSFDATPKNLDIRTISQVVGAFKGAGLSLPNKSVLDSRFMNEFNHYKIRKLSGRYVSPEKIETTMRLMEEGEFMVDPETNIIQITNARAKYQELLQQGVSKADALKAKEEWQEILNFIGFADGQITHVDKITVPSNLSGEPNRLDSPESIKEIYMSIPKYMAQHIQGPLKDLMKRMSNYDSEGNLTYNKSILLDIKNNLYTALDRYAENGEALSDIHANLKRLEGKISTVDKPVFYALQDAVTSAIRQRQDSKVFADTIFELPTGQEINIHKAFHELIKTDVYGSNLAQKYINLIIQKGSSSGNKIEAYKMYMSLKKELSRQLDIKEVEEISVENLIDRYNETRSFTDFRRIVDAATKASAANSFMNNAPEYNETLQNNFKNFIDRYVYKSPIETLQSIAEKYKLQPLLGSEIIDPTIVHEFSQALRDNNQLRIQNEVQRIVETHIEKRILEEAPDLPTNLKADLIRQFKEKDIYKILDFISGSNYRPTAKYVDGQMEYNSHTPVVEGPRDDFISMAGMNGISKLYEVDNRAIDQLTSKDISEVNLDLALKNTITSVEIPEGTKKAIMEGRELDITDIKFLPDVHPNPKLSKVIQVSEGSPFLFEASPENLKSLGRWFQHWRVNKLRLLDHRISQAATEDAVELKIIRDNLEKVTQELFDMATSTENAHIKLRAIYWDNALPTLFERRLTNDLLVNPIARDAFDDNFFKRLKLYEGGNMHRYNEGLLDYISQSYTDAETVMAAGRIKRDGFKMVSILDESGEFETVYDAYKVDLEGRLKKAKGIEKEDIRFQLEELESMRNDGKNKSLESSPVNAISYISADLARVIAARNGEVFDPTKVNGWKPIGYYKDPLMSTTMALKSWLVYDPTKAGIMLDRGIDVLSNESGTKVWEGISNSGQKLEHVPITSRKNFESEFIRAIPDASNNKYSLNLPISSLSIGTQNHKDVGVTNMHSLMNLASPKAVESLIKYQGLDIMIDGINHYSSKLLNEARSEIARGLYEYRNETQGVSYISEVQSLAEGLLNVGMRTDNPVIKDMINRAFMSKTMDMLKRPQNKQGTSSYLITGDLPVKLANPVFRRVSKIVNKEEVNHDLRIQTQLGDIAQSTDWGNKSIKSIADMRFSIRNNGIYSNRP